MERSGIIRWLELLNVTGGNDMLEQKEFEAIVTNIVHTNTAKKGGDFLKTVELVKIAMHKYAENKDAEIAELKIERNKLRILCKDASDYLDTNDLTQIGSGSILHQKFKSEASYI